MHRPLNGEALAEAIRRSPHPSISAYGREVSRAKGDPSFERARSETERIRRIVTGQTSAVYGDPADLDALAAPAGLPGSDLTRPVPNVWEDRRTGLPATFAGCVLVFSSPMLAHERRDSLARWEQQEGDARYLPAPLACAELVPIFGSELDAWLRRNYPPLDDAERDHVLAVDPSERRLRTLWALDAAMNTTKPAAREAAVRGLHALAAAGTIGDVDFDAVHALAERRLELLDAPADEHAEWRRHENNLREAADLARLIQTA